MRQPNGLRSCRSSFPVQQRCGFNNVVQHAAPGLFCVMPLDCRIKAQSRAISVELPGEFTFRREFCSRDNYAGGDQALDLFDQFRGDSGIRHWFAASTGLSGSAMSFSNHALNGITIGRTIPTLPECIVTTRQHVWPVSLAFLVATVLGGECSTKGLPLEQASVWILSHSCWYKQSRRPNGIEHKL